MRKGSWTRTVTCASRARSTRTSPRRRSTRGARCSPSSGTDIPMIIGAGVCLLAGLSGSNTVIYYASSVLKEAGVDDPGLLTLVVGLPNVLGGVIALLCTDKYGRRPLLLWSFG